ncbi:hypothetical protein J1N35_028873 [Gossypium stocksii]|uniref:Uncharacterized protein n=1 Tax=Gossypium stocksii TaxID=47602 RepID=A0A9D3UWR7_9ROSI|nr:hypothetical protein J1N35_028873 [Gossypium stocksii]
MEGIINYLTGGHSEWTCQANSEVPLKFNMAIMFLMAKIWMQFIFTCLAATNNASNFTAYRAVMLYSILQHEQICVGHWI